MANSYSQIYIHYVFSTKNRANLIQPKFETRVWNYIGGIARENNMKSLKTGGMPNHIHALISLNATVSVSKAIQLIKGGSSKWMNDTFYSDNRNFKWQGGYGAFSVSESMVSNVVKYIANQKKHHKTKTFKEEYTELLKRHHMDFDLEYIFD